MANVPLREILREIPAQDASRMILVESCRHITFTGLPILHLNNYTASDVQTIDRAQDRVMAKANRTA
jgi:hypothetical protein